MPGKCMLCSSDESTRYIDLFVFGSEGLTICHECEMKLVEYALRISYENLDRKLAEIQAQRAKVKKGQRE